VRPPNLADVAVLSWPKPGLPYSRVQTKVADQLCRRGEARDVTDRREQADSHDAVHSCDRQKPLQLLILKHGFAQQLVDRSEVVTEAVELAQALLDGQTFIHWKRLLGQPSAPLVAEEIRCRALRNQVCGQNGVDLVLQARAMPNNL